MNHANNHDGSPTGWFSTLRQSKRKPIRRGAPRRRKLRAETLETRQLLAADIESFRHNAVDPEDVNNDGAVSSLDALLVINGMNREGSDGANLFSDVNNDGNRSALDALRVINRMTRLGHRNQRPLQPGPLQPGSPPPADRPGVPPAADLEVRSIDGSGNNLENDTAGAAGEQLIRVAAADYADEISEPAGEDRPSTREISNLLSDSGSGEGDANDNPSERDLSAFIFVWGQFLDHDIDLTEAQGSDGESFAIDIPFGDPLFDPFETGEQTLPLTRSQFDPLTGTSAADPRQQINFVTSYIDGSMVYGSNQETSDSLRSFSGGMLLISENGTLPTDNEGDVLAGDIRAAENLSLTAMQALFVREHNRIATRIGQQDPGLTDEEIFQQARAIVIGEIQAITFNEFLPALLGNDAISDYQGYDPTVDPSIANEFSTAAFRFGHSALNNEVRFFGNDGLEVAEDLALADAFFNPGLLDELGIDSILKWGASVNSQEIDLEVVDGLRNFLFGPPGAGGLDLVALNVQRGRDHGLADYNTTRVAYGLSEVESFADITTDVDLQEKLETLYGDVGNIDLWIGLMAEDHLPGASLGELTSTIVVDQFERLRDGDRLWFENVFDGPMERRLQQTSLADVIQRNTEVDGLQENIFFFAPQVSGTVLMADSGRPQPTHSRGGQRGGVHSRGGHAGGVEGVVIELLDSNGLVVAETQTDARGMYRFETFTETGDYQVRNSASGEALSFTISSGNTRLGELNFVSL